MKIRHIKIRNFRGIKQLDWPIPDKSLFCLIGRGDSTKSTILAAIRYIFYPHWNLTIDDYDFHLCLTNEPFEVEVILGNLPPEFLDRYEYGLFLYGWNKETLELFDEPDEDIEEMLNIRLIVSEDLEPNWEVIGKTADNNTRFKPGDREKVRANLIGTYTDRQLAWGRGSILSQLTESENMTASLAGAARSAKNALDAQRGDKLTKFDNTAQKAEIVAKHLGVPVSDSYKAHLDLNSINVNLGGLSIHDGNIPLRQLGLGSRRMLLCGLQKEALEQTHITLLDEVEIGLEPHRIARLLRYIKGDSSGQYFLTTHSPIVLRELTIDDLYIVHDHQGEIQIIAPADKRLEELNIQGNIRSSAEAFLAKKIIVCEGQTEQGFARGLDYYWIEQEKNSFSFQGVTILNAQGASKIKGLAEGLKSLGYDIAVVADGDAQDKFSTQDAEDLTEKGVEVIMWADEVALEERAMLDLPWHLVLESVKLAKIEFDKPVHENIRSQLNIELSENIDEWVDSPDLRKAIGKAAKAKQNPWFKNISRGEKWIEVISTALNDEAVKDSDLITNIVRLRSWIDRD